MLFNFQFSTFRVVFAMAEPRFEGSSSKPTKSPPILIACSQPLPAPPQTSERQRWGFGHGGTPLTDDSDPFSRRLSQTAVRAPVRPLFHTNCQSGLDRISAQAGLHLVTPNTEFSQTLRPWWLLKLYARVLSTKLQREVKEGWREIELRSQRVIFSRGYRLYNNSCRK